MLTGKKDKLIKYINWLLLAIITAVCSYFIIHDAEWILGDDAIVIRRTGWGHFFPLSDTVKPEIGRFFPMAYFMYNLWIPLLGHKITAVQLYSYHVVIFVLFVIMTYYLVQDMLKKSNNMYRYGGALLVTLFMIGRHYSDFINCYSTVWFGAFLNVATVLFAYLFYTYKKNVFGIITFFVLLWMTYCIEVSFIVPLVWGICGMVLWKKSTKNEKIFHVSLIANALIFLLFYFFFIFLKSESFYSGSHGEDVGIIENAVKILIAQKFLWLVIILFIVRIWDIVKNKSEYSVYDVLILTAAAHCCAGFILKLNWVLYYNRAIVISLPAVVYYLDHYLKHYWTIAIMAVFACFYSCKIPTTIINNSRQRKDSAQFMERVVDNMSDNKNVFLYHPSGSGNSFEDTMRDWLYASFETFLGYYIDYEDLKIERITQYSGKDGMYITIGYNEIISEKGNKPVVDDCIHVAHNEMRNMDAYIKK